MKATVTSSAAGFCAYVTHCRSSYQDRSLLRFCARWGEAVGHSLAEGGEGESEAQPGEASRKILP